MMNIIGVISSSNRNGNTATLTREALSGARDSGAVVTEIYLPEHDIEFCTGCMTCMTEGKCRFTDSFDRLRAQLAGSDGIILSSPTYAATCNAIMKRFLERVGMFERFTSEVFGGKYVAGISTGKFMGAQKVADYLVGFGKTGIFQRGYVSGTLGITLRKGIAASENPEAMKKARDLGRKMAQDIRNGNKYPLQNLSGRLLTGTLWKPMFSKGVLQYKNAEMKGVFENLNHRGLI